MEKVDWQLDDVTGELSLNVERKDNKIAAFLSNRSGVLIEVAVNRQQINGSKNLSVSIKNVNEETSFSTQLTLDDKGYIRSYSISRQYDVFSAFNGDLEHTIDGSEQPTIYVTPHGIKCNTPLSGYVNCGVEFKSKTLTVRLCLDAYHNAEAKINIQV